MWALKGWLAGLVGLHAAESAHPPAAAFLCPYVPAEGPRGLNLWAEGESLLPDAPHFHHCSFIFPIRKPERALMAEKAFYQKNVASSTSAPQTLGIQHLISWHPHLLKCGAVCLEDTFLSNLRVAVQL